MTSSPTDRAVRCRWVTPTVFLDAPHWVEAEKSPWTCIHDVEPRPLVTTEACATCRRYDPARPLLRSRIRPPSIHRPTSDL